MSNPRTTAPHFLVAEDDPDVRQFVSDVLIGEGWEVTVYNPCVPDSALLKKMYNVVILDIIMPGTSGFELRREIIKHSPDAQFIVVTGYPDCSNHERALSCGIHAFLIKPILADQMRFTARSALQKNLQYYSKVTTDKKSADSTCGLIGGSVHLNQVRRSIKLLAPSTMPILITGESGTGKECVARAIHANSLRASQNFLTINCGAFSPALVESELFGHSQGACTGASKVKHGYFEAANGGTLFLDEIGELPLDLQCKFLRILDNGEYFRMGETTPRKADVRIVSATNRNLQQMVNAGRFRSDLLFRLRGSIVHMVPLRERKEDIPMLVHNYLNPKYRISSAAINLLKEYDWPGNVRELIMVLGTLESFSPYGEIDEQVVLETLSRNNDSANSQVLQPYKDAKNVLLQTFDKKYFTTLLHQSHGNLSHSAERADMDRKHLREKLKQLGLYSGILKEETVSAQ